MLRQDCIAVLLLVLATLSIAVDHSNFKTCDQSGFCKRQRAMPVGQSPYQALLDTAIITSSQLSVHVLNTQTQVTLVLRVSALQYNTVRLQLSELTPLREFYQPPIGDVLLTEPTVDRLTVDEQADTGITLSFKENKLVVTAQPFRLDFVVDGQPVLSVNARGLLKWEHYRNKQAAPVKEEEEKEEEEMPVEAEDEENEKEDEQEAAEHMEQQVKAEHDVDDDNDDPSMWEETFKAHRDTKPHGPSSVGLDFSFPGFEFVYGIPEHADSLALQSTKNMDPYRLYNLDVFEYDLDNPMALYGSVPVMLAHNQQRTLGLFWLNAAETWIDISSNVADKNMFSKLVDLIKQDADMPQVDTHWFSESGLIDVFILLGPTANDVFKQYAVLTGTTPLPPLFALAYHQSRWNYNDEQDVASVSAGFDEHDIPLDVIWLDIEHTDGKRYFTWDKHKFAKPAEMIDEISSVGRKMVTIVDPHIKRDDGYHMHQESSNAGYYVKNKDGNDYEGWCWPGSSGWIDFLDPAIRQFWASQFLLSSYEGSTLDLYTWNDMNEPSVFNGPEITMHKDAKHVGGWEHRDVHNVYGMYVHRATVEGQLLRTEGKKRTFVLSRAFFAGSQRYGAVWTGDNTGEWSHLKASIPMLLSLNLVGITFSGADVGGFFKNPDAELLTRWYQAGAYQPFFRAHAHLDTRRREPWLLPAENKAAIRQAIQARYSLLPYWYTLFYLAEQHGGPVMKPLWLDFPTDRASFTVEDEHLVGSALLVHPVTDSGSTGVQVYLPGDQQLWYDVDSYQKYTGGQKVYIPVTLNKIPVFQRGGHIVPRKQRMRRSSSLTYHDPYTLIVTLDVQGSAKGELYLDDFETFQYREGQYIHRAISFENRQLTSRSMHVQSSSTVFTSPAWLERVVIAGLKIQPTSVNISTQGSTSSLEFAYNTETQVLTVRKPAVPINTDFTITLQ